MYACVRPAATAGGCGRGAPCAHSAQVLLLPRERCPGNPNPSPTPPPCRGHSADEAEEGEEGEDGDGGISRWNLRRCSAAGLDRLSLAYGDELLPILLPIVEQRLQVWKD